MCLRLYLQPSVIAITTALNCTLNHTFTLESSVQRVKTNAVKQNEKPATRKIVASAKQLLWALALRKRSKWKITNTGMMMTTTVAVMMTLLLMMCLLVHVSTTNLRCDLIQHNRLFVVVGVVTACFSVVLLLLTIVAFVYNGWISVLFILVGLIWYFAYSFDNESNNNSNNKCADIPQSLHSSAATSHITRA